MNDEPPRTARNPPSTRCESLLQMELAARLRRVSLWSVWAAESHLRAMSEPAPQQPTGLSPLARKRLGSAGRLIATDYRHPVKLQPRLGVFQTHEAARDIESRAAPIPLVLLVIRTLNVSFAAVFTVSMSIRMFASALANPPRRAATGPEKYRRRSQTWQFRREVPRTRGVPPHRDLSGLSGGFSRFARL